MKRFVVTLLFVLFHSLVFSQWGKLNSISITNFNSICVLDSLTATVVGDSGMIYKTLDGGAIWAIQNAGLSNEKLLSVFFVTNDVGYIVGQNGLLLKTINGGSQWQKNTIASMGLNDLYFSSTTNGFVVGENGLIYKTTDGGSNWNEVFSGTTYYLNSIHFTDATNGFITGSYGTFLKTNDGGSNWQNVNTQFTNSLTDVFFINKDTGLVVGLNKTILKTTNGAQSFSSISTIIGEHFSSLYCFDNLDCYIAGNKETIIQIDSNNQVSKENGVGTNYINSIDYFNPYLGYSVGTNGLILKTCPVSEFSASSYTVNLNVSSNVIFTNQSRNFTKSTWLFGDGNSSMDKNPTYNYNKTGDYEIKLITENQSNCRDTISKLIKVINTQSIAEEQFRSKILVTPNPFEELLEITIELDNTYLKTIEIYNPTGRCVFRKNIKEKHLANINLSLRAELINLLSGVYFLNITTNKTNIFRKIIKL